jgi:hypothetical protein
MRSALPNRPSRSPGIARAPSRGVLLAVLLSCCPASFAQDTGGSLQGRVEAPDGAPVAAAEVVVEGPALQAPRQTVTGSSGEFQLAALPLGRYTVRIAHASYRSATFQDVPVRLGRTTGLSTVTLAPLGGVAEEIDVVGQAPRIDPVSTTGGGTLSARYFDGIPLGRDYQSIAALLPSVNVSYLGDGFNIDGGTGFENRYFVDGIEVTDPYRAASGVNLPYDVIQAVEVKTGGYDAEYRSSLGGTVNVVTPSGGNALAGNAFVYWAGHQLSGEARTGMKQLTTENYTQYDVGFSLGGPLGGESVRYFLAFNPLVQRADVEIPGQGFHPDESTAYRFAGNVSWQIDPANNLAFTAVGDPTERDAVGDVFAALGVPVAFENPDPYLRRIENGSLGAALRGTHVLGPRVLLEASLAGLRRIEENLPATRRGREEGLFIDAPTGTWSGGSGFDMDDITRQLTLGVKATWALDRHTLKAGAEYRESTVQIDWGASILTRFGPDSYNLYALDLAGTVENIVPSLFVQDSWRIGSRVNLNLGLRWDGLWMVGSDGQVAQTITSQFQPRLGIVYEPGRPGTQRIYASAGRYVQDLAPSATAGYYVDDYTQAVCNYDHDPRVDPSGCDGFELDGVIQPEIDGLRGQYFDEATLGYDRLLGTEYRGQVRAIYRTLRSILEDGLVTATRTFVLANPGRGIMDADYPDPVRTYKALELVLERRSANFNWLASYVWSESWGNYTGIYSSDGKAPNPNTAYAFSVPGQEIDGEGRLPNDRTHQLKASGFYLFDFGLNVGASILWESGAPLNELGGSEYGRPNWIFLQPRGTAGESPSIFDLSLRLDYTFFARSERRWKPRLILDVYHLFSDERPVDYDQFHYYNQDADGNQIDPNPTYGEPIRYYPPTTVRLGLELSF